MLSMLMTTEYAPAEDRDELQQLLLHIAGGERDALSELYQRTRTAVYGLALSYLKNAQDAQDLTQDVYVQVWDCAAQYRPTGSPMGWLLAVCRSLCLMRLRREERRTALSDEEWDAIPAQECGLDADERVLLQHALATMFRKGMAVLPIPCRTPVVTCCTPRRKMPKLMIAMHGPASGVA